MRDHGDAFHRRATFRGGVDCHRDMVHTTPGFELWLLSWLPGQITPIHDHGGALTVSTVLSGTVFEERFERTSGPLVRPTWTALHEPGTIEPIDVSEIHRVRPVGAAVTLHLYLPTCPEGHIYQAVAASARPAWL